MLCRGFLWHIRSVGEEWGDGGRGLTGYDNLQLCSESLHPGERLLIFKERPPTREVASVNKNIACWKGAPEYRIGVWFQGVGVRDYEKFDFGCLF